MNLYFTYGSSKFYGQFEAKELVNAMVLGNSCPTWKLYDQKTPVATLAAEVDRN